MKCKFCGATGAKCLEGCECAKCVNPEGYQEWKDYCPEQYDDWVEKETENERYE